MTSGMLGIRVSGGRGCNGRSQLAAASGAGRSSSFIYLGDGHRATGTVDGMTTDGPDVLQGTVGTRSR